MFTCKYKSFFHFLIKVNVFVELFQQNLLRYFFISAVICLLSLDMMKTVKAQETLTVSLLVFSVEQRNAFEIIARKFEQEHPDINIVYVSADDEGYKKNVQGWLETSDNIDIMHWAWPAQLRENVKKSLVEPLTDFWVEKEIHQSFSTSMKALVTIDEHQYGIPYSSAIWGVYYRQSIFDKFNIQVPNTWEDFLKVCQMLKENDVTPIAIGTANSWPSASWFDYFNLRINGLAYHQKVAAGEIPFTSEKVKQVFEYWKVLIDKKYFIEKAHYWTFKQIIPLLYRNNAGMILAGNFLSSQLSQRLRDDFRFFRFPTIKLNIPTSEEVPTDLFIIPKRSNNKSIAKKFLRFMVKPEVLESVNQSIHFISPHIKARHTGDYFIDRGMDIMKSSQGYSQYFDRDASIAFSKEIMAEFSNFIRTGDVANTTETLEKIRLSYKN